MFLGHLEQGSHLGSLIFYTAIAITTTISLAKAENSSCLAGVVVAYYSNHLVRSG
jgi:hypothetical protein